MHFGVQRTVSRRAALRLLGSSATFAALVTACGVQAPSPSPAATAPAPAPTRNSSQPRSGGTLRAGLVGDIGLINPHAIGPQPLQTIFSIWDRLIAYDATGKPQPMLAESWDFSSDQTKLQFKLRKGVQFHSGRELTSEDVKWNLIRVRNPAVNANQFNKQSLWFTDINTSDKYTVGLTLDRARPSILDFFELFNIGDPQTLDQPAGADQRWIGTGPFKLADYKIGDHINFARNENYWRSGHPYVDEFDVTIMRDGSAMAVQLEAGALDLVFDPPAADVTRWTTDSRFGVHVNDRSGITGIMNMNTTVPPTSNKLFRQAIHYAIDRERYVTTVLRKRGEARSLPWTSASPAYDAARSQYFTFDLDKARSLIAASGESITAPIDFVFLSTEPPVGSGSLAQILQSDLESIGITLNLRSIEFAALADTMNNLKYTLAYDAVFRYGEFEPSTGMTTSSQYNYEKNFAGFKSDQFTQLITSSQTEADPGKRQALYTQLNDFLLDQCFSMPLATNPPIIAASTRVHDVGWNAHDQLQHDQLWLG